jgi:hypothetical protein
MEWEQTREGAVDEWTRRDGLATVRVRERPDGGFVTRYDRLEQAPEGRAYRRERCQDRAAAERLAAEWRAAE